MVPLGNVVNAHAAAIGSPIVKDRQGELVVVFRRKV